MPVQHVRPGSIVLGDSVIHLASASCSLYSAWRNGLEFITRQAGSEVTQLFSKLIGIQQTDTHGECVWPPQQKMRWNMIFCVKSLAVYWWLDKACSTRIRWCESVFLMYRGREPHSCFEWEVCPQESAWSGFPLVVDVWRCLNVGCCLPTLTQ